PGNVDAEYSTQGSPKHVSTPAPRQTTACYRIRKGATNILKTNIGQKRISHQNPVSRSPFTPGLLCLAMNRPLRCPSSSEKNEHETCRVTRHACRILSDHSCPCSLRRTYAAVGLCLERHCS